MLWLKKVLGPWPMLTVVYTSALVMCQVDVIAPDLPGFCVSTPAALREYGCVSVGECVLHPQTCPCCFAAGAQRTLAWGGCSSALVPDTVRVCVGCVCVCGGSWGSLYALVMHPHL